MKKSRHNGTKLKKETTRQKETEPKQLPFDKLCKTCISIVFSSSEPINEELFKDKTNQLKQILNYLRSSRSFSMTDNEINYFLLLVEKNIFKDYETKYVEQAFITFSNETMVWTHKELIYFCIQEFINRYPEYLSYTLIYKLFSILCLSKDERERIFVQNYLRSLYDQYQDIRNDCRASFAQHLSLSHCSTELLEFIEYASSFYSKPLKRCHREFFMNYILQLHTHKDYCHFQPQLISLIFQYIQLLDNSTSKDDIPLESIPSKHLKTSYQEDKAFRDMHNMTKEILSYITKHFPISERKKQWPFIQEIIEIIVGFKVYISNTKIEELFGIIAKYGICSEYSQISRQTMSILTTPQFKETALRYKDLVNAIFIPNLQNISKSHWDPTIKSLAKQTLVTLTSYTRKKSNKQYPNLLSTINKKMQNEKSFLKNWNMIQKMANYNKNRILF